MRHALCHLAWPVSKIPWLCRHNLDAFAKEQRFMTAIHFQLLRQIHQCDPWFRPSLPNSIIEPACFFRVVPWLNVSRLLL